jgi:hypothetical protein
VLSRMEPASVKAGSLSLRLHQPGLGNAGFGSVADLNGPATSLDAVLGGATESVVNDYVIVAVRGQEGVAPGSELLTEYWIAGPIE